MAKSSGGRKSIAQMKPIAKPSPSTLKEAGVTRPISKPSKSTVNSIGVTPPHPMPAMKKGSKK